MEWKSRRDCIFEKLDRLFVNDAFQDNFNLMEVEHLAKDGSDHAPLLLKCEKTDIVMHKPFKFLKFWTKHSEFKKVFRRNWDVDLSENPSNDFKRKTKELRRL